MYTWMGKVGFAQMQGVYRVRHVAKLRKGDIVYHNALLAEGRGCSAAERKQ